MKKLKYILISMVAAIAFVFMAVTGIKVNAETINVAANVSKTATTGNTYVLKASTMFTAEGVTFGSGKTVSSAANLTVLNYGIFNFNSGKTWGFVIDETNYASYGNYGIYSNGSSRTITVALNKGQTINITAVVFSTNNGAANVTTTTNNSTWIYSNDSDFTKNYTSLKTITDSYTATTDSNYVITFGNKLGFTQLTAEISENTATEYSISYELDGGTNPTSAPTSAYDGTTVTLPKPTKENYIFDGWTLSGGDDTVYTSYTINGSNVTFVANWHMSSYGTVKSLVVSDLGLESDTYNDGIVDGTVFSTYYATVKDESKNGYTQTYKLDSTKSVDVNALKRVIGIHVTSEYGATISAFTRTTSNGTARTMYVCDSTGTNVSTNETGTDGNSYSETKFTVTSAGDYYLYSYSGNTYVAEISIVDNSNVCVMQQEATGTIDSASATYIRFIAIVKDVADINSSDFTFKIYREKDSTVESITRSVGTYSSLSTSTGTYVATLPYATESHTFDGNSGTEFYAIYVVGLTDADYSGYTVYAGFTYGGTEYKTSGYTFA